MFGNLKHTSKWLMDKSKSFKGIRKILKVNKNENKTHENLWDTAKTVLQETFIVLNAHMRNNSRSQKTIPVYTQTRKIRKK